MRDRGPRRIAALGLAGLLVIGVGACSDDGEPGEEGTATTTTAADATDSSDAGGSDRPEGGDASWSPVSHG